MGNITTICESEDRVKCTVNVATWTKKNNYILAMISSKPRNKQRTQHNLNNPSEIELIEDDNLDNIHGLINPGQGESSEETE